MTRPWYAINARRLLEDRQRGLVPQDAVAVVLTDDTIPAPAVYVKADMPLDRLDWRMLVNLQVWLYADAGVALDRVLKVARSIAAIRPGELVLRFNADGLHDVEVGAACHFPGVADLQPVHQFTWNPINLSCTAIGAKLRRALLAEHPQGYVL